jgi:glycosyltransferase involved in cell wall biosynthesis
MALTRHLDPDLLVYACFTNWAGAGQPRRKVLREGELLRQAALVVTNSPLLYERLKHQHPCVRQWPGSVDSHFLALASTAEVVASHRDLPLCCYYGSVRPAKIDLDLLAKVSERYALRLVGPVRGDLPPLGPNGELRGMVAHQEAPLHLRDVDVLVLPYLLGDLTSTVMPAKLFECLATGRPIVSTRLPSLEPYANLLYLSDSHAEFLQNIERALHEPAQRRDERIRIAGENTTDRWMDALSAWIMEAPCHRSVR